MARWRNEVEGGAGRTSDNRGPTPDRAWQSTGPGERTFNGLTPTPSVRQGEDSRMHRRARVTAS
ncbi:hypothetical protein SRB5_51780 [Streptomyces sp. RB5]|uniref:Uncharacterized protein n=1 Tax=Streptomyces smaragdinus TaxID=2585196 RepID=A0A7K0CNK9_9ACTN|nr:hypothetical protein [Streptomyces smaragdinus]MQY15001.1 hypothetical protein [Streptomyces smaragdinus]